MIDCKSVQDLIVKAALYDGVSTTIAPPTENIPAVKITFSKDNRYSATYIHLDDIFKDHEHMALYCCKDALHQLIWGIYDGIKYEKEN